MFFLEFSHVFPSILETQLIVVMARDGLKTSESQPFSRVFGDDDVELLVHDSEVVKKVTYRCKLLQFHMNYRPPYYGTWRKKSQTINPRNPLKTDTVSIYYFVQGSR